ncbi:CDP-glycerol glycerophosphotransferase family protein [Thomasclavelia spiroformis]|uniref:CDP-glycerol glycerophosphotransferase family protein n=1 Tax=Thomasclavelia spiroformis TaxID=29348 RepID=UPI0024B0834A|nr:CDP-glycerol glycerophosphotransferase family protein [Thomasclavelia spiroformis]
MMKNVALKKFLKSTVFKGFSFINRFIPKDDTKIMLYSGNRGLAFNLIPLRAYLIEHQYNDRYKLIYGIEDLKYSDKTAKNEKYVNQIKAFFIFLNTKHVFYTAGQIPIKPSKKQCVIQLDHGSCTLKTLGALTKINNGDENFFTYVTYPNEIYVDIVAKAYNCKRKAVVINGEPMTDVMFTDYKKYNFTGYKKIILWTPTFRQSDYLGYDDSSSDQILPTFSNGDYELLNNYLNKNKILLIAKLHPMQNTDELKKKIYSNLKIYTSKDFEENDYDLYQLMPQVDAMLGDYSSTMLHFLLLDKPLGYVVPDIEEYKEKRGFVFKDYYNYMPGMIIKNQTQFFKFLDSVVLGIDEFKEKRKYSLNKVHKYQDGNNCKRVLELSGIK